MVNSLRTSPSTTLTVGFVPLGTPPKLPSTSHDPAVLPFPSTRQRKVFHSKIVDTNSWSGKSSKGL
jgi:hypothetical protein